MIDIYTPESEVIYILELARWDWELDRQNLVALYRRLYEPISCHDFRGAPLWMECPEAEAECTGSFKGREFPIKVWM